MENQRSNIDILFNATVIVAALGYFVDIYDLLLFLVVGRTSIAELQGLPTIDDFVTAPLLNIQNMQMIGMLIGGVLWGVLGDKKGRLSVLFGSIFLYSVANILNGFVQNTFQYGICRLIAGIGLAGELGVGITLVSEILPKHLRGIGTTIVAAVGLLGAVAAGFIGQWLYWRYSYFVGGGLGLLLLILRISVSESGMFHKAKEEGAMRGNFLMLFATKERALRYLRCIFMGLPTWFVVGILVGLAPVFAKKIGVLGEVTTGNAIMLTYTGLVLGDIASGFLSQYLKSRKKVMLSFLIFNLLVVLVFLSLPAVSNTFFYTVYFIMGVSVGFWVIFVTTAAEQFGTNLRATVTTTVPNFVRGALFPLTILFKYIESWGDGGQTIKAALVVSLFCTAVALLCLWGLRETFNDDLDYQE